MEIPQNRHVMLVIADAHPPEAYATQLPEVFYAEYADHWQLSGLRPANHARERLYQYPELIRKQIVGLRFS